MPTVLVSSPLSIPWYRQFQGSDQVWDGWHFLFNDPRDTTYDYLVAFGDLHARIVPRCPIENTVHISLEPIQLFRYDPRFTNQFGICLTQDPTAPHPHAVQMQPGLHWFVGWDQASGAKPGAMRFRELEALFDEKRDKLISVVASAGKMSVHHRRRLEFAWKLKLRFGNRMDFFGRHLNPVSDKLEALRGYRFHVALENSKLNHFFTEKISDCVIAGCYPLYFGCPNLEQYLPADAFSRIDIDDFDSAVETIERAIAQDYDQTRRTALREARRRVMYEHNLFPMLRRVLGAHARGEYGQTAPNVHYGPELLPLYDPQFKNVFGWSELKTVRRRISAIADRFPPLDAVRRFKRYILRAPRTDVLYGDPNTPGVFVTRVRLSAGWKEVPHWHPDAVRTVTVLSGTLYFAAGEKWDESKFKPYPAGTSYSEASKAPHYTWAKDDDVTILVAGVGPSGKILIEQDSRCA
jgi:hypothetical protein